MALSIDMPFAGHPLDRAAIDRVKEEWIEEQWASDNAFVLPVWQDRPFVLKPMKKGEPEDLGFLHPKLMEPILQKGANRIFLGVSPKGMPHFAIDLNDEGDPRRQEPFRELGRFADARELAMVLQNGDPALMAHAIALLNWHRSHGYCSTCGTQTVVGQAGYKRDCPGCEKEHFPRTDPVVIMMVEKGDKCLLGRGHQFPEGMFSALAGFVEPGETLEEAVAREVMEETGVEVSSVRYHATQPWPYPFSLMIGLIATATTEDVVLGDDELAEARWFSRDEMQSALKGEADFWVPPPLAIAHHLIKAWAEDGATGS